MSDQNINVSRQERWISTLIGAAAVYGGYRCGGLGGLLISGAGVGLVNRGATGHCKMYGALGLNSAEGHVTSPHELYENGVHFEEGITITKPRQELYDYWRNFQNLPRFMWNIKRIEKQEGDVTCWHVSGPAGTTIRYDAELINDDEGRTISWKTINGADIEHAGSVRFINAPGNRGTEVRMVVDYLPPGGKWTKMLATLIGQDPQKIARQNLRRFKQLMETGYIPTTEGIPAGREKSTTLLDSIAHKV